MPVASTSAFVANSVEEGGKLNRPTGAGRSVSDNTGWTILLAGKGAARALPIGSIKSAIRALFFGPKTGTL